jgi:hypothetical protein
MALMHCLHVLLYAVDMLLSKIKRHQIAVLLIRLLPLTRILLLLIQISLILERLHRPHRFDLLFRLLRRLLLIKEATVLLNELVSVHILIEAGAT